MTYQDFGKPLDEFSNALWDRLETRIPIWQHDIREEVRSIIRDFNKLRSGIIDAYFSELRRED